MTSLNFTPFPTIKTERLILRQLTITDDKEIFALRSDPDVEKYLERPKTETIDDARAFISNINVGIKNNDWIFWAICLDDNPELIGTICLWNISPRDSKAEIGYELLPRYQGKGIMQEAFMEVIRYGFDEIQLDLIEAVVHRDNFKSIRLLDRNGFIIKGRLNEFEPDVKGDTAMVVYVLSK